MSQVARRMARLGIVRMMLPTVHGILRAGCEGLQGLNGPKAATPYMINICIVHTTC